MSVYGWVPLGVDGERLRLASLSTALRSRHEEGVSMTQHGLPVPVFSIFPLENVLCLPRDLE